MTENKPTQHWDPRRYAENARFVADLGLPVVELLDPRPGEAVLDLGCGDGALTLKLVEAGAKVAAVDASPDQIAAAATLGLDARVLDGAALDYEARFDAVFSNAALHWMCDPQAVLRGVWRALKPGGRFVGEMGGGANVRTLQLALVAGLEARGYDGWAASPWYFPALEEYRDLLEAQGFQVRAIEEIERPTRLPGEMAGWLATFGEAFIKTLPEADQAAYIAEVAAAVAPRLRDPEGVWWADYVRLRFAADKPVAKVDLA